MFSSNQKLEISGTYEQLKSALEFALKLDGTDLEDLCYQITEDGKFCLGWWTTNGSERGWEKFQFDFDTDIVSKIIIQFLSKQKQKGYAGFDGSTEKGFVMSAIPETFSDFENGIKNPFYGIVSFKAFTCFYSK
jgi:hypothetical protein